MESLRTPTPREVTKVLLDYRQFANETANETERRRFLAWAEKVKANAADIIADREEP